MLLSVFYPITKSFNSISPLMWKCEGRKQNVGKVGIGWVTHGLKGMKWLAWSRKNF